MSADPTFAKRAAEAPVHKITAAGSRRITLEMFVWRNRAASFKGAPRGEADPIKYLDAFQKAEPYLGLPKAASKFISFLVRLTEPCDWEEGSRPIAWPSASDCAEFLGRPPAATKALTRKLQEAGLFVMRDGPQGIRSGYRDLNTGRIIGEADGFDLSLLAIRYQEFVKIALKAEAERDDA